MKKLATLELDATNAALQVGAPWYTSGAHMWKGAAAILKPNPATTMTMAIVNSGSAGETLTAAAMGWSASEPERPKSRLKPKSRIPADMPPKRKYLSPASADGWLCLSNAVRT